MPFDTNLKILLVEDAGVMRKMEIKTLKSLGFQNITEAVDGEDAINKLGTDAGFDLVISDWNMPNKDGFELLNWIRSSDNYKKTPFLMATGRGEKKEIEKAIDAGVNSFISKPFDANELKVKIEEALGLDSGKAKASKRESQFTKDGKVIIKVAHIQITDHLVLGVLKHLIKTGDLKPKHFELETECMSSWNPLAKSLEDSTVDGACVLAPIAMDIYSNGTPIKLVLNAHKNGSIFIRNKKGGEFNAPFENYYKNKTFYLPHFLSIHHMLAHMFFSGIGLKPGMPGKEHTDVNFEVVPPIKMPELIAENPDAAGYLVAEPLGTKAIAAGNADTQFLSSELWQNHPCCVVTLQEDFIKTHTDAVYEFVEMLVHAGKFIDQKPALAAEIAVDFLDPDKKLGLKVPLLKNVLTEPLGIKTGDLYPSREDLDFIQRYMHDKMNIGSIINTQEFVDLRFADAACKDRKLSAKSVIKNSTEDIRRLLVPQKTKEIEIAQKALLNKEGKYLMFTLENQEYGVDILKIKEIVQIDKITEIPDSPSHIKGIVNLRGSVIPVFEPKTILGLTTNQKGKKNLVVVLELELNGNIKKAGISVDSVSQVVNISTSEIEDAPGLVRNSDMSYILAISKKNENLNILLDIEKMMYHHHKKIDKAIKAA